MHVIVQQKDDQWGIHYYYRYSDLFGKKGRVNDMKTQHTLTLVFAVAFLIAVNVQADILRLDDVVNLTTDRVDYLGGVHGSDWIFTGVGKHTGSGNPPWTKWELSIKDSIGESAMGAVYSDKFNGNGANGAGTGTVAVNTVNGTASMSHNSANNFEISFSEPFATSFYIALTPWSSYSAATAFNLNISYWDSEGNLYHWNSVDYYEQTKTKIRFTDTTPFLGFNLEEGFYLASVRMDSIGTPNNGYAIRGMGFGDNGFIDIYPEIPPNPSNSTPEPATLVMIGLGLAGLGLAARRRN